MARHEIKASELFEPVKIDLWGPTFLLRQPTIALEDKLAEMNKQLENVDLPTTRAERELRDAMRRHGEDSEEVRRAEVTLEEAREETTSAEEREKTMPLLLDMLDAMLEPEPVEEGEKKVHAKTVIKQKLEKHEIGLSHVDALVKKLGTVALEARPT